MIRIMTGDLFESDKQTLVNATNTEGIMGGGIALAFKRRFPEMYEDYVLACEEGDHTVFKPHFWKYLPPLHATDTPRKNVLNIATKDLIKNQSTIPNICSGLKWLILNYQEAGITSLAIPALGCGLGGLYWSQVLPVMISRLDMLDNFGVDVDLYRPGP